MSGAVVREGYGAYRMRGRRRVRGPLRAAFLAALAAAASVAAAGASRAAGARSDVELARGPYLQSLLADSVRILWRTTVAAEGSVRLRRLDEPDGAWRTLPASSTEEGLRHEVRAPDLEPDTAYRYEVWSGDRRLAGEEDAADEAFEFRTPPPAGTGSVRAVVIGDSGQETVGGVPEQRRVREVLEAQDPGLFLHTGDLNYEADARFDRLVFEEYAPLMRRMAFWPARGNHNLPSVDVWLERFSPPEIAAGPFEPPAGMPLGACGEIPLLPASIPESREAVFCSFDHGPVHVAVFDSNARFEACSHQIKWLAKDLADARDRGMPWRIIMLHHVAYSAGAYGWSPERPQPRPAAYHLIPPLADAYGVDLVVSGHDHNYQRSHPIHDRRVVDAWQSPHFESPRGTIYVVTGGGGGPLYPELSGAIDRPKIAVFQSVHHAVVIDIDETTLRLRAVRADRVKIDEISITKSRGTPPPPALRPGFRRGDANFDGALDIADPVVLLGQLFQGRPIACPGAWPTVGDVNASGPVDIADAVYLLNWLFRGGAAPAPPFERCEPLPDFDDTGCLRASCRV